MTTIAWVNPKPQNISRQAEVGAAKTTIERTEVRFDIKLAWR